MWHCEHAAADAGHPATRISNFFPASLRIVWSGCIYPKAHPGYLSGKLPSSCRRRTVSIYKLGKPNI